MTWCYHKDVIGRWDNGDGSYSVFPLVNLDRSMITKVVTVIDRDIL